MRSRLKIFISYRRAESLDFSGHLYGELKDEFEEVFYDTEGGIGYDGDDFLNIIKGAIEKSDIFLLVIGEKCCQEFQKRDEIDDYVLKEVVHAKESGCIIIPILMQGVEMPQCLPPSISFISHINAYPFTDNRFTLFSDNLKIEIKTNQPKAQKEVNKKFITEVADGLQREKLVVLFSQDATDIDEHYRAVKSNLQAKFTDEFYLLSIPTALSDEARYFQSIACDCRLSDEVKSVSDWGLSMRTKLQNSKKPLLLFVTEIESGDTKVDRLFATTIRNLKNEFSNFHALFIGRKKLAELVYAEGDLSPLNNAKEIFFPDITLKLGEQKIAQQFQMMGRHRNQVCKLLEKEKLGYFSTWSYNETLNSLFWKNLLVKEGMRFAWRGALTREIGREVLGCEA